MLNHLDIPHGHQYLGFCRNSYGNYDWITDLDINNLTSCYDKCLTTIDCTAFTFHTDHLPNHCDLYRGGPYTQGSFRYNTVCYTMPGKYFL